MPSQRRDREPCAAPRRADTMNRNIYPAVALTVPEQHAGKIPATTPLMMRIDMSSIIDYRFQINDLQNYLAPLNYQ
jgi:hypothetical protein